MDSYPNEFVLVKLIKKTEGEGDEESVPNGQVVNVDAASEDEKKSSESSSSSIAQHDAYSDAPVDKSLVPADAKRAFWLSTIIIIIISVLVPIPLGASTYIFSPRFFTGWIVVSMVSYWHLSPTLAPYLTSHTLDLVVLCGVLLYYPAHLGEPRCVEEDFTWFVRHDARTSQSESIASVVCTARVHWTGGLSLYTL